MQAGFAMLESGFCRAKNTVNILCKKLYREEQKGLDISEHGMHA